MTYAGATIVRAKHDKKYFRMHRDTAQDRELSWEARGLIAYVLSKPDNWEIQVKDLEQGCAKGRVYRILDELKKAGYLESRKRYKNKKGKWQYTPYILHERPLPQNQDTEFADTENQDTENADILDTTELEITESEITEQQTTEKEKNKDDSARANQPIAPDDDFGQVCRLFSDEKFGELSPRISEQIQDALGEYDTSWVIDAMNMAIDNNAAKKWKYAQVVLENCKAEGHAPNESKDKKEKSSGKKEIDWAAQAEIYSSPHIPPSDKTLISCWYKRPAGHEYRFLPSEEKARMVKLIAEIKPESESAEPEMEVA